VCVCVPIWLLLHTPDFTVRNMSGLGLHLQLGLVLGFPNME